MFPSNELINGEQLVYVAVYGSTIENAQDALPKAIAEAVRNRMNVMNGADLVDVTVTGLSGPTPHPSQIGVLVTLRTRAKSSSV